MLILASACKDASFMTVMLFIKKLVDIIFIIAPIILILLLTIDFSKAVIEGSEDKINHIKEVSVKRILFAIVLLFVPLIVDTSFSLLPENKSKVIDCYNNASQSNVDKLVEKANKEKTKQEKKKEQRLKNIRKKQEQEAKKRAKNAEEARKKAQQKGNSGSNICTNCVMAERIATIAEKFATPEGSGKEKYDWDYGAKPAPEAQETIKKYYPNWVKNNYYTAACCCHSTRVILAAATGKSIGNLLPNTNSASAAKAEIQDAIKGLNFEIIDWDGKGSSLRRGDILSMAWKKGGGHVQTYIGNNKTVDGGRTTNTFSHIINNKTMDDNVNDFYYFYVIRYKE